MKTVDGVRCATGGASIEISDAGIFSFTNSAGTWVQRGPFVVLNYYDRQHPRAQAVALPSANAVAFGTSGTLSLSSTGVYECCTYGSNSIQVKGVFKEIEMEITFRFVLESDGSGFRVVIDQQDILENHPMLYRVLSIEVLPQFNYATTGENGYLVLPNWSGTRMFFNKKVSREVRQTVYSSNDQWEWCCNMPVFGMHRENGTMATLITAGENDAKLVCRQHYEEDMVNCVHPEMVYRWYQEDDMIEGQREVRYSFAAANSHKGEAYVYIAKKYRDWLYQEKNLLTWAQKAETRPEAIGYRDRFMLKFFMGYKDPHPEGIGEYHTTATFADVKEILEDLMAHGVTRICAILVGWNIDGHDGMPPTRMPVDERLGGETAMRELVQWCKEQDIMLGVHDSYGGAYTCSPEFNIDELIRHRTGEYWESIIWSGGQVHKICPAVYIEKYVPRDIADIAALGVHGHHHIDAVGSFMPCFSEQHPLPLRSDNIECNRKMFEIATTIMGSVSTEMPFGSYFDLIDGVYHCYKDLSAWHAGSAAAKFRDESIPLLLIALHGSIKMCMSLKKLKGNIVEMAAWGIAPQWEVGMQSSPPFGIVSYSDAKERLIDIYRQSYGENGYCIKTEALLIDDYRELPDGSTQLVFEDGSCIEANIDNNKIVIKDQIEISCLV